MDVSALPERPTTLQRLVELFQRALTALNIEVQPRSLENWSVLVHECMSGRGRKFHDIEHVFELSQGMDPIQTLAALFHDTVYYQVDGGLSRRVTHLIGEAIDVSDAEVILRPFGGDMQRRMVTHIFGFSPGQMLSPYGGLNEYLSALLAARSLADDLPPKAMAEIIACIEATIPFRPPTEDGKTPSDALFERLKAANRRFSLDFADDELEGVVHRAVALANTDVAGFANTDSALFLDNTWQLLPESNDSLRGNSVYTIKEYRSALHKMQRFFEKLDPTLVFRTFRNTPDPATLDHMTKTAQRNVQVGHRYLRAKLVAASLLDVMAEYTGGDAPISLFMGDLPRGDTPSHRLEDFLPKNAPNTTDELDREVLTLLSVGRRRESGFDLKNSPLAAVLYEAMGDDGLRSVLDSLDDGFGDPIAWLRMLPLDTLLMIIEGCKKLAVTRAPLLDELARDLANGVY